MIRKASLNASEQLNPVENENGFVQRVSGQQTGCDYFRLRHLQKQKIAEIISGSFSILFLWGPAMVLFSGKY